MEEHGILFLLVLFIFSQVFIALYEFQALELEKMNVFGLKLAKSCS